MWGTTRISRNATVALRCLAGSAAATCTGSGPVSWSCAPGAPGVPAGYAGYDG